MALRPVTDCITGFMWDKWDTIGIYSEVSHNHNEGGVTMSDIYQLSESLRKKKSIGLSGL